MISEKSKRFLLNTLESRLLLLRGNLKECQSDKNCPLETYENIVDECQQIEYTIQELEHNE